jgi:hypothetical protein
MNTDLIGTGVAVLPSFICLIVHSHATVDQAVPS